MTAADIVLLGAFLGEAIALSVLVVLLARAAVGAVARVLDRCAKDVR